MLEARLNAACSAYASIYEGKRPESHFNRALSWFPEAGLEEPIARTFVGDVRAPLSRDLRIALASLFEMLWGEPQPTVSSAEWSEYQRLCRPESPDFILDLPGYYAFFTYTMFKGRVTGRK
jgi:demethylmenaquinone methyltransferase/2-methoxy-6-polyprenyl-1,4-benzoquinol methylase